MAQRRDLAAQNAKKDKLIKESDENARKQVDQVSTHHIHVPTEGVS